MKQEYSRDLSVDVQSYSKLEIVFSLFLIINSNLSTTFTAMPDGCLYYFPKGHIFRTIYLIDDLRAAF